MGHPVSDRRGPDAGLAGVQSAGQRQGQTEGNQHADRDAQFRYLAGQVAEHAGAGHPVVSVDAKKKNLVGDTGQYPSGISDSDKDIAALPLVRQDFHGEWTYTINPAPQP